MSGSFKNNFAERWGKLSPWSRTGIALTALFGGMMGLAAIILPPANQTAAQNTTAQQQRTSETHLIVPQRKDTSLEGLAAGQEAIKADQLKAAQLQAEKDHQIEELKKQLVDMSGKKGEDQQGLSQEVLKEIAILSSRMDEVEKNKGAPNLADALPSPDGHALEKGSEKTLPNAQESMQASPPVKAIQKISIIGAIDAKPDAAPEDVALIPYLSGSSQFEGYLINGMDAPTSSFAQKNPTPTKIRIKTDALMPNGNLLDVKECAVMASGYGVMSTERAIIRTETISCIRENGEVIEAPLDGYIVGEDGKVGLRGRVVSRQGALLAKTLMAGFLGGFSSAMVPAPVPQMNISPGNVQQYQTPNIGMAAQAGAAQGLSTSAKALSDFYLSMAKDMFPGVEIDAGRRITIILVKGVQLQAANNFLPAH
jgi:conjugal transfer pilus assembly protein TraB